MPPFFARLLVCLFFGIVLATGISDAIFSWLGRKPPGSAVERKMPRPPFNWKVFWKGDWTVDTEEWLQNRSWLAHGTAAKYRELTFEIAGRTPGNVIKGKNDWLFLDTTIETPSDQYLEKQMTILFDKLTLYRERFREQGIPMVVLLIPNSATLFPENTPSWMRGSEAGSKFIERLSEGLRNRGIPTYDSTAAMRAAERPGKTVFFRADNHWTYRGAQVATEGLAVYLAEAGFIRPRIDPVFRIDWRDDVQSKGGILKMLGFWEGSKLSKRFYEPMQVPSFLPTSQRPTARVGWSGTSFSNYESPDFFATAWGASVEKITRPAKGSDFTAGWALKHFESSESMPPDFVVLEFPEYHLVGKNQVGGDLNEIRLGLPPLKSSQLTPCHWEAINGKGLQAVAGEPGKWRVTSRDPSLEIQLTEPALELQLEIALSQTRLKSQIRVRGSTETRLPCFDGGGFLKYRFPRKKSAARWQISWSRVEPGQILEIGSVSRPKIAGLNPE